MALRANIYTDNTLLTFNRHVRAVVYVLLALFVDILIDHNVITHYLGILTTDILMGVSILGIIGLLFVVLLRFFPQKLSSVQSVVLLDEHKCFVKGTGDEKGRRVSVDRFRHIELRMLGKSRSALSKWIISMRWETDKTSGKGILILSTSAEKEKFYSILESWYSKGINISEFNDRGEPAFLLAYPLNYTNAGKGNAYDMTWLADQH